MYNFLRSPYTVFSSSCIILHSYWLHIEFFLYIIVNTYYFLVLFYCVCVVVILMGVKYISLWYLHFPKDEWCWTTFHGAVGPLYVFFREMPTQDLPFSNWLVCCCWVISFLYIFWVLSPYQICYLRIFLSILWVAFLLTWSCLWCTRRFNFDATQFIYFYFCYLCFVIRPTKSLSNLLSWSFLPEFPSNSFIILVLIFSFSELIFVYMV